MTTHYGASGGSGPTKDNKTTMANNESMATEGMKLVKNERLN